jgi:putative addiction module component (TIGR02574 family)
VDTTAQALLALSSAERLRLIEALWESLVDEQGDALDLSPELAAELDLRLEEHRRDPDGTLTLAQVQAMLRGSK